MAQKYRGEKTPNLKGKKKVKTSYKAFAKRCSQLLSHRAATVSGGHCAPDYIHTSITSYITFYCLINSSPLIVCLNSFAHKTIGMFLVMKDSAPVIRPQSSQCERRAMCSRLHPHFNHLVYNFLLSNKYSSPSIVCLNSLAHKTIGMFWVIKDSAPVIRPHN